MDIRDVIAAKRDGRKHTRAELQWLAQSAARGEVADYQISAWLMAAYLHPLDAEETAWLTLAMAQSGERLDLTGLPKPWVDKHSTGGVGDKTTLVLLPLLAACGLTVVKMSGRGLGITGGTVDKLSSVPGFRTDLSPGEMKDQARRIGLALTGQTPNLAPADKVFYALRNATATVSSIPLIVSSILSKKIAGGAETVVLDVKAGSGAFMKNIDAARTLARALRVTGELAGLRTRIAVTDMDQPLGRTVGNALEVEEAGCVLAGNEPSRFCELCLSLAGLTLHASGLADDLEGGYDQAREALVSGRALAKAQEWFSAQGGDADCLVRPDKLPRAPVRKVLAAQRAGWVSRIDAGEVGQVVVALGGGRHRKEDQIDPAVGVELHVEKGGQVRSGDPLFTVHARDEISANEATERLSACTTVAEERVSTSSALLELQ